MTTAQRNHAYTFMCPSCGKLHKVLARSGDRIPSIGDLGVCAECNETCEFTSLDDDLVYTTRIYDAKPSTLETIRAFVRSILGR